MAKHWMTFWFTPTSATDLGVARALFFGGCLLMYIGEDFAAWGGVARGFWMPMPLFTSLRLNPVSPTSLHVMETVWRVALGLAALGLYCRTSMCVAAVLGLYLLGLPHNFGQTYHFDALLVIVMAILAMSRAADAYSIDKWRRGAADPPPSGEYTWPIRMVWVAMAFVFLAAGLAKVRNGGLEWVLSSNMSNVLTKAAYHVSDADPLTDFGLWIARHAWLSQALAAASLTIELAFVLALFSRAARVVLVPAAFLMLIGIRTLMGPTFGGFLIANVFWVPWQQVLDRVRAWTGAGVADRAATKVLPHVATENVELETVVKLGDSRARTG